MTSEFETGKIVVGKYQFEREIGQGGLGAVYLATDLRLNRPVAIKTLRYDRISYSRQYDPSSFESYLARFEREATISSYFTANPNIITVYGVEEDTETNYYLIMEYLEGGSLAELIRRDGNLSPERAVHIALDICHALAEIHRHPADIVHRDLKPSNILLRTNRQAVVADFGIAQIGNATIRATSAATRHPGSPSYMSPEQQKDTDYLTPTSDLYSLGLILYEMLTGYSYAKSPFLPTSRQNSHIPLWLDEIVAKLLQPVVTERYQNAGEVSAALQAGLAKLVQAKAVASVDEKTTPLVAAAIAPVQLSEPTSDAAIPRLERPEGTMNTRSFFYIERSTDKIALDAIGQEGVTITIKGPRQMGKSSLLLRVREAAIRRGKRVALFDFQLFDKTALTDPDRFFRQFCDWISDELELDSRVSEFWDAPLGNSQKTTRYLQRYLLKEISEPLVLAMDEVDRIFDTAFRSDFFGMLRSWHNARQTSPFWQKLDLVLVTSTEPYQLIEDLNQSPFNVGEVIELVDFTLEQVGELNRRHGTPLNVTAEKQLMNLLAGHPYLVRRTLYLVASGRISSEELFSTATSDRGPFGDHLRNQLFRLHERAELVEGMRQVVEKNICPDERVFFRLRGAGLVRREGRAVVPRCKLYADYFSLHRNTTPQTPATPVVAENSAKQIQALGISERELEVLKLVAAGLTNAQVAEKLVLSTHTVNSHLTSIYGKLGVGSRTEAVRYFLHHQLS